MRRSFNLSLLTLALAGTPLSAQWMPDRTLSLSAGPMSFDASGTGTAVIVALSAAQTLPWRWLAMEASLGYAGLDEQFSGSPTRFGVVEVEAQLQWPGARFRPYLGAGPGLAHYFTNAGGRRATEPAVVFGAGLRAGLTAAWALRLDTRIRGWRFAGATDWAVNTSGEITVGVSRGL